jgi:hypothetical protein
VIVYLFVTYAIDIAWRSKFPVAVGSSASFTTPMTPLNPFLALEVLLRSNEYLPHDPVGLAGSPWFVKLWMGRPIAAFSWLCVALSIIMIAFSTLRLRVIGAKVGTVPWYRKILGLSAKGATERPARTVSNNPVAWREATARGKSLGAMAGRWGFVAAGVVLALVLVTLYHTGLWTPGDPQLAVTAVVSAEIVIITLAALNMSATAVSREREDGSLDIILTTPIQPGPYLAGKLKGLIQFLLPMICVPVATLAIMAMYVLTNGLGKGGVMVTAPLKGTVGTVTVPVILPEGALAMPIMLAPFVAFCVMIGLQWSIKSKGTIGSVIAAVSIVVAVTGVLSLCGIPAGTSLNVIGGTVVSFSPINLIMAIVYPASTIPSALGAGVAAGRISLVIGSMLAAVVFALIVYGMHNNMKRTFMATVRRMAGQT